MSRLSRAKRREQQQSGPSASPIDVHVPTADPRTASVGGVPVRAADGEEIQQTVLNHLHGIALTTGHPVRATIQDDRIGYAVPLQVHPDGSSELTGDPTPTAPRGEDAAPLATEAPPRPNRDRPTHLLRAVPDSAPTHPLRAVPAPAALPDVPLPAPARNAAPAPARFPDAPVPDPGRFPDSAHFPDAPLPAPVRDAVPDSACFPDAPLSAPASDSAHLPDAPLPAPAPGTVAPPMGEFGPPPVMDAPVPRPFDARTRPLVARKVPAHVDPVPEDPALDAAPKPPTPPRGFDAVAEAVLGDEPLTGTALLAEPVARINAAVREGRTPDAAELAARTVAQASQSLGPEHPEVLRLRELAAYIAYLAGDPARACALSLDLARIHHRAQDAEAAYGNVLSAATAWRGVRDPEPGLRLGEDLVTLWATLVTEGGPAAEDAERLESARARMNRLTERARSAQS
ncbi:tetratricopeptide repeat protein [Streptomyces sp. NPDC003635]